MDSKRKPDPDLIPIGPAPRAGFRSEMTEAGEQTVIPGCERDAPQSGVKQMDLF